MLLACAWDHAESAKSEEEEAQPAGKFLHRVGLGFHREFSFVLVSPGVGRMLGRELGEGGLLGEVTHIRGAAAISANPAARGASRK